MKLVLGRNISLDEINNFYDHNPLSVFWILMKAEQVKALRLRQDYNPNIFQRRAEIWVGADSQTKDLGEILAKVEYEVPLYVKQKPDEKYTYVGYYKVLPDQPTQQELAAAREKIEIENIHSRGISRIIFLNKIPVQPSELHG